MQQWEYMFVTCDGNRQGGLRPRWVNGQELPHKQQAPIVECATAWGLAGWELVSASAVAHVVLPIVDVPVHPYTLVFKRPIPPPPVPPPSAYASDRE